jgi:hypothetical protein
MAYWMAGEGSTLRNSQAATKAVSLASVLVTMKPFSGESSFSICFGTLTSYSGFFSEVRKGLQ